MPLPAGSASAFWSAAARGAVREHETVASPSKARRGFTGRLASERAISGKRPVQSWPARLTSVARPPSTRPSDPVAVELHLVEPLVARWAAHPASVASCGSIARGSGVRLAPTGRGRRTSGARHARAAVARLVIFTTPALKGLPFFNTPSHGERKSAVVASPRGLMTYKPVAREVLPATRLEATSRGSTRKRRAIKRDVGWRRLAQALLDRTPEVVMNRFARYSWEPARVPLGAQEVKVFTRRARATRRCS